MYTQNTPVHVKLWHREFWHLALANLLLTMSVYMLISTMPQWMLLHHELEHTGLMMLVYGVGLFLVGGFCSYLVQHERRNHVCLWAIVGMMLSYAVFYYGVKLGPLPFWALLLIRLCCGAFFGLTQMVLMSTLIIDTCESFQRTEANHCASWFGRFALSLGPLCALVLKHFGTPSVAGFDYVLIGSMACCLLAAYFIITIRFPFKAPEDNVRKYTLDRFFLPQGIWLFLNLVLITAAIGVLLSLPHNIVFYSMMMSGFLLALIAQKYVFVNAELKSEVISGLFLLGCALLMLLSHQKPAVDYIAPVFIGTGTGIIGVRFLLFFIKLSHHCQRGTSQSTYFLGWEFGLAIGLAIGYAYCESTLSTCIWTSLVLVIVALLMYQFFTHSWYLKHKNR